MDITTKTTFLSKDISILEVEILDRLVSLEAKYIARSIKDIVIQLDALRDLRFEYLGFCGRANLEVGDSIALQATLEYAEWGYFSTLTFIGPLDIWTTEDMREVYDTFRWLLPSDYFLN